MRRLKLPEDIREEVAPKNILMIGPTGVGKTEIARRLAKLTAAPFLKVEATKYTEVGYVGRDVESMIRDLMAVGFNMVKAEMQEGLKEAAEQRVEEALLDLLLPPSPSKKKEQSNPPFLLNSAFGSENAETVQGSQKTESEDASTRERFRQWLREGKIEDKEVEITITKQNRMPTMEIFAGGNIEDFEETMQNITSMLSGGRSKKKMLSIKDARRILLEEELDKLVDTEKVSEEARKRVEEMGIIFIDEIDKIAVSNSRGSQDVSREGVQRDILPIVEGSTVNTKHGIVDTTHILFIAAGAFNLAKPSDLIPELQGRFPLRVELDSLTADDFKKILTEPKNALTKQYSELLKTESVTIDFKAEAIDTMSAIAQEVNAKVENIGARRLHTIMETVLEELSFEADERSGETIEITSRYVEDRLESIVKDQDLSKYIL
jgi:ATP-dependent HslUV protease ATP-binding subunit HslU